MIKQIWRYLNFNNEIIPWIDKKTSTNSVVNSEGGPKRPILVFSAIIKFKFESSDNVEFTIVDIRKRGKAHHTIFSSAPLITSQLNIIYPTTDYFRLHH